MKITPRDSLRSTRVFHKRHGLAGGLDSGHQILRPSRHFVLLASGSVIVAEEMEQAMGEQKRHFLDDWAIALCGLAGRGGQ
jgi:hypothetical protein